MATVMNAHELQLGELLVAESMRRGLEATPDAIDSMESSYDLMVLVGHSQYGAVHVVANILQDENRAPTSTLKSRLRLSSPDTLHRTRIEAKLQSLLERANTPPERVAVLRSLTDGLRYAVDFTLAQPVGRKVNRAGVLWGMLKTNDSYTNKLLMTLGVDRLHMVEILERPSS